MAVLLSAGLPVMIGVGPIIQVDLLYNVLSRRLQFVLDALRGLCLSLLFSSLAVYSWPWAARAFALRERHGGIVWVPIYLAKVLFSVALTVSALVALSALVRVLVKRSAPDHEQKALAL